MNTEQIIMDYIERHRMTTGRCLPVPDRERAQYAIDRLVMGHRISQWTHRSGLRYWTRPSRRPLSDPSLVRTFAVAIFCSESEKRSLISPDDLEKYFPTLFRHGLPAGMYVSRADQIPQLGHVRVDSVNSRINRIAARAATLVDKFRKQDGFRELIRRRQFELTWIVPTLPKQRRLIEALQMLSTADIQLKVIAVPELLNVIAPLALE